MVRRIRALYKLNLARCVIFVRQKPSFQIFWGLAAFPQGVSGSASVSSALRWAVFIKVGSLDLEESLLVVPMIYPGNRAQDNGSLTYTSAPVTELNGRRRTKSGDTLGQGEVESESQAHASVRDN